MLWIEIKGDIKFDIKYHLINYSALQVTTVMTNIFFFLEPNSYFRGFWRHLEASQGLYFNGESNPNEVILLLLSSIFRMQLLV